MKNKSSTRTIGMILLALSLCFTVFTRSSNAQTGENLLETSEVLYVTTYLVHSPVTGEILLIKDTIMEFNNTMNLPLNYSLPSFNEYFQSVKYKVVLGEQFWIELSVHYSHIDINLAEKYTDEICDEFLRIFDLNLSIINRSHTIDDKTGSIKVNRKLGYFEREVDSIEELVKYKPLDGFGQLITRDFISMYIPGGTNTGLLHLYYYLTKVDQKTLYWTFVLGFSRGEVFGNEDYVNLNLNELLNQSDPFITPSTQRSSKIVIQIVKEAISPKTYHMSLESISPASYTDKEENGVTRITYDLTDQIDNVVAKIRISKEQGFDWNTTLIAIAIIITVAVFSLYLKKKRQRGVKKP